MKLFGQHVHPAFVMLGVADYLSALVSFLLACWIAAFFDFGFVQLVPPGWPRVIWAAGFGFAVTLGMLAMGLYQPRQRLGIEGIVARQIIGLAVATALVGVIDLLFGLVIPGTIWAASSLLGLFLLVMVRLGFDRLVDQEAFRRRVLVLGAGERASTLLQLRRKSDQRGFRLVAFVAASGDRRRIEDARVVDSVDSLLEYAQKRQINEIVVAMDERRQAFPILDLLDCRFAGIDIVDIVYFLERETGRVHVDLVTPDWMIYSVGFTANAFRDFVLRALDLAIVVASAIVTVPVMLLTAIAIFIEDGRPILYRQVRVGLQGRHFTLYKFRSMIKDAESEGGARWAESGDSRVTRVGSIIRKYRLDELPQLVNVFRGEMSIVGPRPERPEFTQNLSREIPYYNERHCVKPGITGWAQMSYPYGSSEEDARAKLAFDLYYVKYRSLIFNLSVLLQTAEVILWNKGAR